MKQLDQRERDRQDLGLEEAFEDLRIKAGVKDLDEELETLTNLSMQEFKEEKKQVNIYKPTLKKQQQQQIPGSNFYPSLGQSESQ